MKVAQTIVSALLAALIVSYPWLSGVLIYLALGYRVASVGAKHYLLNDNVVAKCAMSLVWPLVFLADDKQEVQVDKFAAIGLPYFKLQSPFRVVKDE